MIEFSEKTTRDMALAMADVASDPNRIPGCFSIIIDNAG